MTHKITLIPGDGIGPEVTEAVLRVLTATGVSIEWEVHVGGGEAAALGLDPLPPAMLESVRRNGLAKEHDRCEVCGGGS